MESNEWMRVVIGLVAWGWDVVRAAWEAITWRDVLLLLILVGVWGDRRHGRRAVSRLQELREKLDDMNELTRLFLGRRDEKVDRLERILGLK